MSKKNKQEDIHVTQEKLKAVRAFILRFMKKNDHAPTCREISENLNMSIMTAYRACLQLERLGEITRTRKWRGITVAQNTPTP